MKKFLAIMATLCLLCGIFISPTLADTLRIDGGKVDTFKRITVDTIRGDSTNGIYLDSDADGTVDAEVLTAGGYSTAGASQLGDINQTGDYTTSGVIYSTGTSFNYFAGNVSIGTNDSPSAGRYLDIDDTSVNSADSIIGIDMDLSHTDGVTSTSDHIEGINMQITMNDADQEMGHLYGVHLLPILSTGTLNDDIRGVSALPKVSAGTAEANVHGAYLMADIDGGTVDGDVRGMSVYADIESATTAVGGDVIGIRVDVDADQDPVGSAYCIYINEQTNVDFGIYQNGTAPNYFAGTLLPKSIAGNTLIVGPSCPYTTIGAAMTAAAANDTILVTEGTYTEAVVFSQDNLTLRALGSAENTIIDIDNAVVVDFSTKSGCTLDGFTVNQDAVDANDDYAINSSNDSTTDYNIVENCIIDSSINSANRNYGVYTTAGNIIVRNNIIKMANASTSADILYAISITSASRTAICNGNTITVDYDGTGTNSHGGINLDDSALVYIYNNQITVATDGTTTGRCYGIIAGGTASHVNANTISVTGSSTGIVRGIYIASSDVGYIAGNEIQSSTGDSDGKWLSNAGTAYATGNIVTGDMEITPGTWNGLSQASTEVLTATLAGVAASLLTDVTVCITDAGGGVEATNVSLADGTLGQTKIFTFKTEADVGDTVIITPATPVGFATVTFDAVGDTATMYFDGTSWMLVSNNNATIG